MKVETYKKCRDLGIVKIPREVEPPTRRRREDDDVKSDNSTSAHDTNDGSFSVLYLSLRLISVKAGEPANKPPGVNENGVHNSEIRELYKALEGNHALRFADIDDTSWFYIYHTLPKGTFFYSLIIYDILLDNNYHVVQRSTIRHLFLMPRTTI